MGVTTWASEQANNQGDNQTIASCENVQKHLEATKLY